MISKIIFSSSDPRGHVGYSHHFAFIIVVIVVVISFSHFIQLIWNYRTILKQIWLNSSWVVSFQNCVQHFWNQNNNSCEHIICIPILVNIVEDSNLLFFLKKITKQPYFSGTQRAIAVTQNNWIFEGWLVCSFFIWISQKKNSVWSITTYLLFLLLFLKYEGVRRNQ